MKIIYHTPTACTVEIQLESADQVNNGVLILALQDACLDWDCHKNILYFYDVPLENKELEAAKIVDIIARALA